MEAQPFFQYLCACFEQAAAKPVDRYYRIANCVVHLQFAHSALIPLITPALDHLSIPPSNQVDLTISIADSETSKITPNIPPWSGEHYLPRGEMKTYLSSSLYAAYDRITGALSALDTTQNRAIYWLPKIIDLPWWLSGSPLQAILHWWLRSHHCQLTHAGAVGYQNKAVLLAGRAGAGKSTTVLSCLEAGMLYLSEDYCLLSSKPEATVFSLYNSAKLESPTLKHFPHLHAYEANSQRKPNEKSLVFYQDVYPNQLVSQLPLAAVLVLNIDPHQPTQLLPTSKAKALLALSASTICQLVHANDVSLKILSSMLNNTACYQLILGRDLATIPTVIKSLLTSKALMA